VRRYLEQINGEGSTIHDKMTHDGTGRLVREVRSIVLEGKE
jgi:hypothetical protein